MAVERSGYELSERVRSVVDRLSRSSSNSAVALVTSGGEDAAVEERWRRDLADILAPFPKLLADI